MNAEVLRYEDSDHSYWLGPQKLRHCTELIDLGGLDPAKAKGIYTDAHRQRGTIVHKMAQDFDLGVVTTWPEGTAYRGRAEAYAAAMRALKPTWEEVEIPDYHPEFRYGYTADRAGVMFGRKTVLEIKPPTRAPRVAYAMSTGGTVTTTAHSVQLALQALGKAFRWQIPAEMVQRVSLHLKDSGRYDPFEHTDPRDFIVARDLIRRFCR